jgi:hypothetical protein
MRSVQSGRCGRRGTRTAPLEAKGAAPALGIWWECAVIVLTARRYGLRFAARKVLMRFQASAAESGR